jgi:1,5-anhydro-D-fructose reductase (1,5-anhydro-D-mannitol-forming)
MIWYKSFFWKRRIDMKTIRWGIIGCGDVTEIKSGPAFQKAEGSALVAVMRRDGARAADYANRHGVPRWYDNGDALIADPEVDAVYVATPPDAHEEYAIKACHAGKPCYIEKPMARNAAEGRRMVQAFAARGLPLFVAYYRRSLPRFVKAKEIIDSGMLGELRSVHYHFADNSMRQRAEPMPWRFRADIAGAGLFLDLGSHALDLLDFILGPLVYAHGTARNVGRQYDVEDQVEISFSISNGVSGSARWWFCKENQRDEFIISGDRAELGFACLANEPVLLKYTDGRQERFDLPNPAHVHQPLVQCIVDELRGERNKSPSTGESALRTQEIMDRALEGYYGGRENGFWKRAWPKG